VPEEEGNGAVLTLPGLLRCDVQCVPPITASLSAQPTSATHTPSASISATIANTSLTNASGSGP
jgi:hypothetical protein